MKRLTTMTRFLILLGAVTTTVGSFAAVSSSTPAVASTFSIARHG